MKIALCLEFPLGLQGGVSVVVQALATGFRDHYELVLVSPDSPRDLELSGANSLFVEHIPWRPEAVGAASSKALAQRLAQSGVRLAHFHSGTFGWGNRLPGACPISYPRRRGIHVCTTVHLASDWLAGFCGPQKPLWFKLLLLPIATAGKLHTLSCTDHEICVSQHDYRILARRYWPLRRRFVQIYHSRIPAGIPSTGKQDRRKVVLCVGHLARRKGQSVLAEAFCKIAPDFPEWELWFAGPVLEETTAREIEMTATAAKVANRVKLLGERLDARELMREAAIYVQPSLLEPLGLALQEAMFAGCACIGSRVGGIPELISDDSMGLLMPPGDAGILAHQLSRLIRSPEDSERLGRAAARSITERNMTWENMIQQHLTLYAASLRK
jgi:glycosyltransferase involved in cell wall biosynthesis